MAALQAEHFLVSQEELTEKTAHLASLEDNPTVNGVAHKELPAVAAL